MGAYKHAVVVVVKMGVGAYFLWVPITVVASPPLPQAASLEEENKKRPCKRPIMTEIPDKPPKRKRSESKDFTSVTPTPFIPTKKSPRNLCPPSESSSSS